jgi:ABC-type nitrate/sulfonate/bicarbonate transport system substrate-binding protein
MRQAGIKVKELRLTEPYPGHGLIASNSTLQNKPDLIRRFVAAFQQSLVWAYDNPNLAIGAFQRQVPAASATPTAALVAQWKARRPMLALPKAAHGQWGYTAPSYWTTLNRVLVQGGVIKQAPPISELYTTNFIPKAKNKK